MSVIMCIVWRYRLVVSIILVVVLGDVLASDAQPIGKVYPRGNHWAVGHLMGKKSTDEQDPSEDSEADRVTSLTLDQDLQQDLPLLLYAFMSERMTPRENTEINAYKLMLRMMEKRRQWEENREQHRQDKLVDLLQALRMQYDDES